MDIIYCVFKLPMRQHIYCSSAVFRSLIAQTPYPVVIAFFVSINSLIISRRIFKGRGRMFLRIPFNKITSRPSWAPLTSSFWGRINRCYPLNRIEVTRLKVKGLSWKEFRLLSLDTVLKYSGRFLLSQKGDYTKSDVETDRNNNNAFWISNCDRAKKQKRKGKLLLLDFLVH